MLLKCLRNKSDDLDENARNHLSRFIRIDRNEVYLDVGTIYVAYGVTFRDAHPWFYVYEDPKESYPIANSHHYFEIVEGTFDPSWRMVIGLTDKGSAMPDIIPMEWAEDSMFYEKLVDDDPEMVAAMKPIKERIANYATKT
jgi:hypothetical protein